MSRNSLGGIDGKVKLTDVRHFPNYEGNSIDIVKEIVGTKDYKAFGMFLLNDDTDISVIEEDNPSDAVGFVIDVFKAWIQGKAGLAVDRTWKTLVQCLRAKKLNTIADNIVKVLSPSDGGHSLNEASDFTFDSKLVCNFTGLTPVNFEGMHASLVYVSRRSRRRNTEF